MHYQVMLTAGAKGDLRDIYQYISVNDSLSNAVHVLDKLTEAAEKLATFPDRGSIPMELLSLGIREYRQILFKSYRMIYRVIKNQVFISLITDGRRDMQTLLARRLVCAELGPVHGKINILEKAD